MISNQKVFLVLGCAVMCLALVCQAQDYDDENYPGGGNGAGGQGNQGDNEQNGYGNDDGYSGNMPNYQQNVDSDSSNQNPASYSPQTGGSSGDADGDYEGDDSSAAAAAGAASAPEPSVLRVRRSAPIELAAPLAPSAGSLAASASEPKLRVKRHGKYYIGPVYTYVKTDKHANFKWGVSIIYST